MAVINTIDDVFTHPITAGAFTGARRLTEVTVISMAAADDDGSIYFCAELPDTALIDEMWLEAATIGGLSNVDVGLYTVAGALIDVNTFASGLDMTTIAGLPLGPYGDGRRSCMTALAVTDANKPLWQLAGDVNKPFPGSGEVIRRAKYRIGLAAVAAATAAGTVIFTVNYRIPGG